MARTAVVPEAALVLIGDRVAPHPYLQDLVKLLRAENESLPGDRQVQYVICDDYAKLALALRKMRKRISLILVGPGLNGKQDMVARLIGREIKSVLVMGKTPLAESPAQTKRLLKNLVDLGVTVVSSGEANEAFWEPIVRDHVIAGIGAHEDIASMTPEQRAEHLDKRLESVTMFPSLPETQNRVAALDDLDHPKKWAEAINSDVPMKTVILNLLNSAHYSFRSRITTIDQAVALASARTIREVVLACTVQRLFRNVEQARINQFWRHSVATGFFAKILSLPAVVAEQAPQEKTEYARLNLEDGQKKALRSLEMWKHFDLPKDGDAFTSGLLHDIGKVTIALCFEDCLGLVDPIVEAGVTEADQENRIWAESPRQIERALMNDLDHQIIGGRIARRWGLSPIVQEVITQHHMVRRSSGPLLRLVALANIAANGVYSYPYSEAHHPFSRLFKKLDEAVAANQGRDPAEVVAEVFPHQVECHLESVLAEYEVPENLWKTVDPSAFFQLVYQLRPHVRRLTNKFLQMTSQIG